MLVSATDPVCGHESLLPGLTLEIGDQTGPTSALNLCTPEHPLPKHFLIPLHQTYMSDEDENFLRRKGVFNLPSKSACDSMIEAYLVHVNPILPVIEVDVLVNHHRAGRLQDYNLLLLWSLFFVAINARRLFELLSSPKADLARSLFRPRCICRKDLNLAGL